MECTEIKDELLAAKSMFCSTNTSSTQKQLLVKIKAKIKIFSCCDSEEEPGSTTTTTTSTTTTTTTTTTEELPGLRLVYDTGTLPANNLAQWNTLFNLPAQGTAFTSFSTAGDTVTLIGGAGITLANTIFLNNADLKEIHDDSGCIVAAGNSCFVNCVMDAIELDSLASAGIATFSGLTITTLVLPALVTAGDSCFGSCITTTLTLAALETAGVSCFQQCTATAYTLTALETAGESCFQSTVAASFTLPSLLTIGDYGFYDNTIVTTILTAALTALGTSVGNNSVFLGCTSLTGVTVPTALQTVDAGNPDGDLVYAVGTLGTTITYV